MNKLTDKQISENLDSLENWKYENSSLKKVFRTKGFPQTLGLVSEIGALCQQFDHHPDYLTLKYAEVEVSFSTHSVKGVTEKDFEIAKQIELL